MIEVHRSHLAFEFDLLNRCLLLFDLELDLGGL